jgi:hypothetical protein
VLQGRVELAVDGAQGAALAHLPADVEPEACNKWIIKNYIPVDSFRGKLPWRRGLVVSSPPATRILELWVVRSNPARV